MFTLDTIYFPAQESPIVLAQAAVPGAGVPHVSRPDYLLKMCMEVANPDGAQIAKNTIDLTGMFVAEIGNREHRHIDPAVANIRTTLLENTTHGKIMPTKSDSGYEYYIYESDRGYLGKDTAVFLANFEGKRYKVSLNLVVSKQVIENPPTSAMKPVCPIPTLIRVKPQALSGVPASGAVPGLTWRSTSLPSVAGRCAIKPRSAG